MKVALGIYFLVARDGRETEKRGGGRERGREKERERERERENSRRVPRASRVVLFHNTYDTYLRTQSSRYRPAHPMSYFI